MLNINMKIKNHFIITKYYKILNILIAEFGKLSPFVISKLFNQYCCSFSGSPLWSISGAAVQALCVDWRKALRSMWRLNSRTHCDLITVLSSQIPLIVSLKKRFAKFINRCLSSHNTTLQFISCVAINMTEKCRTEPGLEPRVFRYTYECSTV